MKSKIIFLCGEITWGNLTVVNLSSLFEVNFIT